LTCSGSGGGGSEDGGGPGYPGSGGEDGGPGGPGSGGEDGGPGHPGNGGEDGGPGTGGEGGEDALPPLCTPGTVNDEPDILLGYFPANGQSVSSTGQIKVWVSDEWAPVIAPNEQVDPTTGTITTPGDRTAKASDGYLYEPAVYIAPQSAENGGTPHFPQLVLGTYDNDPANFGMRTSAPIDPPPTTHWDDYTGEFIWNVSSLGLSPGTYILEFVIHDGDYDRGVGCITLTIVP
jgi:hypothetical protein